MRLSAVMLLRFGSFAGLTTLSLRQGRSHHGGRRWNISGSVLAAFEPFVLSSSGDVITLWDRRDESILEKTIEQGQVSGVLTALGDIRAGQDM